MTTDELTEAIVELREADALATTDRLLDEDVDPAAVLDASRTAMDVIGDRFACGEAFIPELVMAGEIMHAISEKLKPRLAQDAATGGHGVVVLGTAQGDIHDIGKDIVATMLDIAGFRVVDLGVDVPPERFVAAARENDAAVVGVSALLTQAIQRMKQAVAAIDEAGLRPAVRVMIGGAPITGSVCEHTGADGWGKDAMEAVDLARGWTAATPGTQGGGTADGEAQDPAEGGQ
jgi:5-methyltetrahydrofolate--homocysteine methyltransferase